MALAQSSLFDAPLNVTWDTWVIRGFEEQSSFIQFSCLCFGVLFNAVMKCACFPLVFWKEALLRVLVIVWLLQSLRGVFCTTFFFFFCRPGVFGILDCEERISIGVPQ